MEDFPHWLGAPGFAIFGPPAIQNILMCSSNFYLNIYNIENILLGYLLLEMPKASAYLRTFLGLKQAYGWHLKGVEDRTHPTQI